MVSARRRVGCCGGVRIGKSIVRNASKTTEKQMVQHADAIYEDPFRVLPSFQDDSCKKWFKKTIKQIHKVDKIKDNPDKLEKFSNKRNLAGAIAGTLLVHHAQKAPFLAATPLSTGTVLFALRGNALREHLIAVQHYDDPFLRLLGIREIAIDHDLHVYSWDKGFICTGKTANPPKEFVSFVIKKHQLTYKNDQAHCTHLTPEIITKDKKSKKPWLLIEWKSANLSIGICEDCSSQKTNFLFETTKYLIEPDIQDDFTVKVVGHILKDKESEGDQETMFLEEYFNGALSDKQMITKNMRQRLITLKDSSEQRFILDEISYESIDAFIEALNPADYEKKALIFLLNQSNESLIVSDVTPNSVIEMLWQDHGKKFLEDVVGDTSKANDLYNLSESPSQIIKTAYDLQKRIKILKHLPEYENLPSLAKFVDMLARTYRLEGKEKMVVEIKKQTEGAKGKAISYGFLLAVNKQKDFKWKYKKEEIESGEFLKPYIETLLSCPPESYHQAFQDLLTFSGTSIDIADHRN